MKRLILAMLVATAAACTTTNGPDSEFANVQVSFATQRPAGPLASGAFLSRAAGDTIITGIDTLVIDRVQVVLREIELKRVETTDCDSAVDGDACEEFEAGPVLVDLPLGNTVQQTFAVNVPIGTYNEIGFDIHKPDDGDPDDQTFVTNNPAFADISIRVEGTFNGRAYVYTSDLNVEQELALVPALEITDMTVSANLTILIDIDSWFRDQNGAVLDPASANKDGPNEGIVKENIKNSVEAFEDDDQDGEQD